jgi:hypothetical protein
VTGSGSSECLPCSDPAVLRDYFFLGFVCLVCVGVRLAVIAASTIGKPGWAPKTVLGIITVLENALAMLFTLLILEPQGSLVFNSCRVVRVSDFYPIFYNPSEDYVHQLHCSYEVVYPLYRMIFVYFGFYLVHHILLLSVTVPLMWGCRQTFSLSTEFVWLVALPVVIAVFAVLAGLLYYIFDYLTILVAVGGFSLVSTFHQALKYTFKNPFRIFSSLEYWMFMLVCMTYAAFGILSLTDAGTISFRAALLPTVLALFLHPIITLFASPQPYLSSWGIPSYHEFYEH